MVWEKEEEEEEKEEGRKQRREAEKKRKDAHINTYATQTKIHKGPALVADTISRACRYEHTNLSESGLAEKTASSCCIYEIY